MIESRHVYEETPRQRDVAGDARSFFPERLLRDLDDDFLTLLEQFGDQRDTARLRPMASSAMSMLRTAAPIVATPAVWPLIAASPGGMLHPRAKIAANSRRGRLRIAA